MSSSLEFIHVGQRWQHHKGAHFRIVLISALLPKCCDAPRCIVNFAPIPDGGERYCHFLEDFLATGEEYIGGRRFRLIDELDPVDPIHES